MVMRKDTLISNFIKVSEDLVEGILRYPLSEFEIVPEIIKQAVMYSVANMYEKREDYDAKEVIDIMTKLYFHTGRMNGDDRKFKT